MDEIRKFILIRDGRWTYSLSPELAEPPFMKYCTLPVAVCPDDVFPVVSSVNTEVRRFQYQQRNYFLKEYFFLSWKKHLKVLRRGERLARVARQMDRSGFHTPRIVGIGRSGKNRRVVTEAIEDARDIWQVLYPDMEHYRGYIDDGFVHAFGRTIGNLHKCGFFHGDLRWRNVLTRQDKEGWKFYFIDNDRTVKFRFGIPLRCRIKNLTQILFSGLLLDWPRSDWETFLQGYFDSASLNLSIQGKLVAKVEEKAGRRLSERRKREEQR